MTDTDGNVYVAGDTGGALGGPFKGGAQDAWVIKFDGDGHRLWRRQPGTSDSDFTRGVAIDDDGNVYVVGYTFLFPPILNAFVIKLDSDGHLLWRRQPGTSLAEGVAIDKDGSVYVVGETNGALGGPNKGRFDAWVIKFDDDGHRLWSRQPGTSDADYVGGVATDTDGNVSIVGETGGALGGLNKGLVDAWVIKFDGEGDVLWKRQPGTSDTDRARGVVTDKDGNVSVVGDTDGALGGPHKGFVDAWVIKFDGEGDVLWKRQPGTSMLDLAFGVTTDKHSNVSVVGWTDGSLGGPNKGIPDAWVIKYAR